MAENYREPNIIFDGWTAPEGTGIIVTGAASGIGAATAILAAQSGLKVAAWDMFAEGIKETIERAGEYGVNIKPVQADLSSDEAVQAAMEETLTFCKPLYLANVAGPKMLNSQWNFNEVISIAVGMIHRLCLAFEATEPGEGSAIVNVAALAGVFEAGGGDPWYASAKSAIAGYTRHQAVELKGRPRMNCVCPGGPIHTPRNHGAVTGEFMQHLVSINPMGRPGRPEEEATAIMFLLSPASSYINGVILAVDGGLHLAR
ncbi:3-oxoacyl-[acyl-carrier protein] reductase [Ruminiclostridium sufflavum DSM 19573]|uniref:3-oxoacyl-[acyl-carrier protein] reductase n=1 Tax=Ruminiclostridium sufflavum DSM 19573 TaxID=1121337 RepID=A0A318XPJ6_9FIRM|nr:SDR family oxidoreductase [Ruminiclostridium sufflavum]PYG90276.1 3-oxoacyl-[acyl-carrier protein] reductase [Ruminiclostridium sufflavum DSM 19573]